MYISALAAGRCHSLALSDAGELHSFGGSRCGQLGNGDQTGQPTPLLVAALKGLRVTAMAAGRAHSLALSEAGEVYSFGEGKYGRLDHGNQAVQPTPLIVAALQGLRMGAVAAGGRHSS